MKELLKTDCGLSWFQSLLWQKRLISLSANLEQRLAEFPFRLYPEVGIGDALERLNPK